MGQLIIVLAGISMLVKGEVRASKGRRVPSRITRAIGIVFLVAAMTPFVTPYVASWFDEPGRRPNYEAGLLSMSVMFGICAIAVVAGLILSERVEGDK